MSDVSAVPTATADTFVDGNGRTHTIDTRGGTLTRRQAMAVALMAAYGDVRKDAAAAIPAANGDGFGIEVNPFGNLYNAARRAMGTFPGADDTAPRTRTRSASVDVPDVDTGAAAMLDRIDDAIARAEGRIVEANVAVDAFDPDAYIGAARLDADRVLADAEHAVDAARAARAALDADDAVAAMVDAERERVAADAARTVDAATNAIDTLTAKRNQWESVIAIIGDADVTGGDDAVDAVDADVASVEPDADDAPAPTPRRRTRR